MRAKKNGQSALFLLDVIDTLSKHKIPYAVIGAFAGAFYGMVRASLDADALISLTDSKFSPQALTDIFSKEGLIVELRLGDSRDPVKGIVRLSDKYDNQVDLILGIRGMDEDALKRTVVVSFSGRKIKIIGVEDFVAMKIFAGSPRDIDDARSALDISRKNIDFTLLEDLVKNYGRKELALLKSLL